MMSLNSKIAIATLSLVLGSSISAFTANATLPKQKQPVVVATIATVSNTTIIPGKQVGAITRKTKRADLVKLFGASKLKDEKESRAISGDGVTLSSSNPSLKRLGVNVGQMIVFF